MREEWNPYSLDQLVMDEGWREEVQSHDPNQLIGHHDRATKWHNAIPMVRSGAVVTA